jgi:ribonuclease HII
MASKLENFIIIDEAENYEECKELKEYEEQKQYKESCKKQKREKQVKPPLHKYYFEDPELIEIGVDEAGRGPLFGRVYTAAVVLPKDDSFDHSRMKDSKKFTSKNKKIINDVADYIKEHAITWAVTYSDEKVIDEINILQATQKSMHESIKMAANRCTEKKVLHARSQIRLLIDGNYFNTMTEYNKTRKMVEPIWHTCVEGGDNKYTSIAAASILAKVARDQYIEELCAEHPELIEKYGIHTNKGYGSKKHMDGIKEHGITIWHRRSFAPCSNYT